MRGISIEERCAADFANRFAGGVQVGADAAAHPVEFLEPIVSSAGLAVAFLAISVSLFEVFLLFDCSFLLFGGRLHGVGVVSSDGAFFWLDVLLNLQVQVVEGQTWLVGVDFGEPVLFFSFGDVHGEEVGEGGVAGAGRVEGDLYHSCCGRFVEDFEETDILIVLVSSLHIDYYCFFFFFLLFHSLLLLFLFLFLSWHICSLLFFDFFCLRLGRSSHCHSGVGILIEKTHQFFLFVLHDTHFSHLLLGNFEELQDLRVTCNFLLQFIADEDVSECLIAGSRGLRTHNVSR